MKKAFTGFLLCPLLFLFFLTARAQDDYVPPSLSNPDSWSIIMLPDPQTYVKFERNQPILDLMMAWIDEHIDSLHIKLVVCTGDLVEQNEMINPDGIKVNEPSKNQWETVSRAFDRLNGKVPYITAAGNHDYGVKVDAENRMTHFNEYFPVDKNFLNQKILREVAQNASGIPTLENSAYEFTSPQGRKFLFLSLEFAPRDTIISWAKKVAAMDKYKDHTVVVLTHSYMNARGERFKKEHYGLTDCNYGEAIWEKLIQPSKNIEMVLAGHIGKPDDFRGHVAFRTDLNAGGKKVQQMVFNAQAQGGGWYGDGGDGWLRILEFLPDGKTVSVRTFSPFFAISPTTRKYAWRRAPYDEFSFELE